MANPKSELIAYAQRQHLSKPQFKTHVSGPDHEPTFHCEVVLGEHSIGKGQGPNKKIAEKRAAEEALHFLNQPKETASLAPLENLPVEQPAENFSKGAFQGPYPIFEHVLVESLRIAHKRVDSKTTGPEAIIQIKDLSLKLYKETLLELGELIEENG